MKNNRIVYKGYHYLYERKLAKNKDLCLGFNPVASGGNDKNIHLYSFSSKDPGDGKALVVTKTDNPVYILNEKIFDSNLKNYDNK